MISKGTLNSIFDEGKVYELENSLEPLNDKEKAKAGKLPLRRNGFRPE